MLCRQRPDLSDLSIRTQEGILVKNSKNISIKELIAEKAIYLVFIILLVAIVVVEPRFLSFNNFKNIFAQSSTKIIIALAAGMVLVVQGVDLSTGRMIGLAAVIFASLVQNPDYAYRMYPNLKELPLIVPLLLVLAICLVLGGISGVLVAVFKVPPFIATLGMQLILYGASSIYFDRPPYGAQPIGGIDSKVTQIAIGSIGIGDFQIPYLIIIAAAVCVVMWIVWNKTKFGKYMFAVGGNPEAAKVSGVNVIKTQIMVYAIAGMMYAFAAALVLYYETRKDPQEYTEDILACPEHIAVAKRAAEESMVLLKNENHVLPLDKEKTEKIVVLGVLGDTENIGDHGSSKVHPYYTVTPFKGLMKKMPKAQILYNDGSDLERAKELAADADAVVIVAGYIHSDEGEYLADRSDIAGMGGDRASMRLHQRDIDLIHGVKGVNPNTVVSIIGSSAILIDEWEKDVPAIIFSFYSGMEGGNVLADILFGDVCPSGKLPYTVALSEDSYPDFDPDCTYAEYEYYHGYCKMDKENIPVLYPFGYGLSYTTFDISEPTVEVFDKTAKISVNVKNTGDVKGAEVVQLYIGCEGSAVDRPVKILKDFARVELMPGEEKKVSLQVSSKDMAYYSEEKDDFVEEDITYIAYTGDCSCKEALKSVKFEFGK